MPYFIRAFASQIGGGGVTLSQSSSVSATVLQGDEVSVSLTLP